MTTKTNLGITPGIAIQHDSSLADTSFLDLTGYDFETIHSIIQTLQDCDVIDFDTSVKWLGSYDDLHV